jgi:hypothetical protein
VVLDQELNRRRTVPITYPDPPVNFWAASFMKLLAGFFKNLIIKLIILKKKNPTPGISGYFLLNFLKT